MFFNNPQFFQHANHGRSRTYYYSRGNNYYNRGNNYREKQFDSNDEFAKFFFGMPTTSYSVDFSLNDCINIIFLVFIDILCITLVIMAFCC